MVGQVAAAAIVDEDDQVGLLVAGQHARYAIAQAGALACHQCGGLAQARLGRGDVPLQAGDQVAEHPAHVAGAVFADHHALPEHRDTTEGLVVAVIADTVIGALRRHQQVRIGIGAHELRVAAVRHRGGTALGGDGNVVLLLELVQVLLLQVDLARCLCPGRDERQDDGGGKAVETALIHWRVPLTLIG